AGRHVPQSDFANALAPRNECLAVWAERNQRSRVFRNLVEKVHVLAGGDIPELDGVAAVSRGQCLAVGTESQRVDAIFRRVLQGGLLLARRHVPEADRVIASSRGEGLAVRPERDAANALGMSREGGLQFGFLAR